MNKTKQGEVIELIPAIFEREVLHSKIPVVVDFWASWCGPCTMLAPVLEQIAKERAGQIKVCKVNVKDCTELAAQFGVRNLPTVLFFNHGDVQSQIVGKVSWGEILAGLELEQMK